MNNCVFTGFNGGFTDEEPPNCEVKGNCEGDGYGDHDGKDEFDVHGDPCVNDEGVWRFIVVAWPQTEVFCWKV